MYLIAYNLIRGLMAEAAALHQRPLEQNQLQRIGRRPAPIQSTHRPVALPQKPEPPDPTVAARPGLGSRPGSARSTRNPEPSNAAPNPTPYSTNRVTSSPKIRTRAAIAKIAHEIMPSKSRSLI